MRFKNPDGQLARWLEVLSSYSMKIEHRPGRLHGNADGLSRIPCRQCGHEEEDVKNPPDQFSINQICQVKSWLEAEKRPLCKDIDKCSHFLKSLLFQWQRLAVMNDILVRKWEVTGTDIVYLQAIIPLKQRRQVLKYAHGIRASGHLGVTKALNRIRQRFYWPGLQNDVRAYVTGCEKCAKRKGSNRTKMHQCK